MKADVIYARTVGIQSVAEEEKMHMTRKEKIEKYMKATKSEEKYGRIEWEITFRNSHPKELFDKPLKEIAEEVNDALEETKRLAMSMFDKAKIRE